MRPAALVKRLVADPGGWAGADAPVALIPPRCTQPVQSAARRSRSALAMTETELKVMAALASTGLSNSPKDG